MPNRQILVARTPSPRRYPPTGSTHTRVTSRSRATPPGRQQPCVVPQDAIDSQHLAAECRLLHGHRRRHRAAPSDVRRQDCPSLRRRRLQPSRQPSRATRPCPAHASARRDDEDAGAEHEDACRCLWRQWHGAADQAAHEQGEHAAKRAATRVISEQARCRCGRAGEIGPIRCERGVPTSGRGRSCDPSSGCHVAATATPGHSRSILPGRSLTVEQSSTATSKRTLNAEGQRRRNADSQGLPGRSLTVDEGRRLQRREWRSTGQAPRKAPFVQPSTVKPSTFNLQPSTFGLRASAFRP